MQTPISKVFCSVLLNRLKDEVDNLLREKQAGLRRGRSCSEQILTLRNIIEQCYNWNKPLCINFIDFKKAFNSIHRESLWKILKLYNIPEKYINIFKALYRNSSCCVRTKERLIYRYVWYCIWCQTGLYKLTFTISLFHGDGLCDVEDDGRQRFWYQLGPQETCRPGFCRWSRFARSHS